MSSEPVATFSKQGAVFHNMLKLNFFLSVLYGGIRVKDYCDFVLEPLDNHVDDL